MIEYFRHSRLATAIGRPDWLQVDNFVALVELRVNSKSTLGLFDCFQTENALNIRNAPTPAGWLIPEREFEDFDMLGPSPLQLSIKLVRRSDKKCTILCEAAKVFYGNSVDIAVEDSMSEEIWAVYIDFVEHPRWQFLNWERTHYHIQLVGLHWLQMPDGTRALSNFDRISVRLDRDGIVGLNDLLAALLVHEWV